MKCEFCHKDLIKTMGSLGEPISIPRIGIIHRSCAEQECCEFCGEKVFLNNETKGEAIYIKSVGAGHALCAEQDLVSKHIFSSRTHLKNISIFELYELRELVQLEINHREDANIEPELF
ncbi:MAG: hypothetical protein KUG79_17100 [Pseudomonadales bacterium]|nr:hypothetical protein [Pseudomonadales bacterium]